MSTIGGKMSKIKRQSLAIIISLSTLLNTSVSLAYYYNSNNYNNVYSDTFVYEEYDRKKFDEIANEIAKLLRQQGKKNELSIMLDKLCDEYALAMDKAYAARLGMDRKYNQESLSNKSRAFGLTVNMSEVLSNILLEIYHNQEYTVVLHEIFGKENTEKIISSIQSEIFYDLAETEEKLINEYIEVQKDSDKCAEIFLKLVEVRNKMANAQGYDNYADYADFVVYGRPYTDEQIEIFSAEAAECIKPLMPLMLDTVMYIPHQQYEIDENDIVQTISQTIGGIDDELKLSYDYMVNNNLYDISYSEQKNLSSGAYTVRLPYCDIPYLFMAPRENNSSYATHTLIHEFGHFSAMLNDPIRFNKWKELICNMSIDTSEIQSQGLEMLTVRDYGKIFGKNAAYERYSEMLRMYTSILDGCMFDEWQEMAYKSKNLTVDELNKNAVMLIKKYYGYEQTENDAQKVWTNVAHNFLSPMYYISYAVSGVAALDIFRTSSYDRELAIDKYMTISSLGCYVDVNNAIEKSDINDLFKVGNVSDIIRETAKELGLSYDDVDYKSWYAPYLYMTSSVFEGVSDDKFCPYGDITRAELIKLLRNMHNYYAGTGDDNHTEDDGEKYLSWAYDNGIITGYENGEFYGSNPVTREELITILYRLKNWYGVNSIKEDMTEALEDYNDCAYVSKWAKDAVAWAVSDCLIEGRDNNLIDPQGHARRAEVAKIIAMFIKNAY